MRRGRIAFEATTPAGTVRGHASGQTAKALVALVQAAGTVRGHASGQTAKALVALVQAGQRGITALECDTWAYRLAAYCHFLRRDWGLVIRTERENHPGGWHGRHVLETPVRLIANDCAGSEDSCDQAGPQHAPTAHARAC